jgi:hypothetical protein
MADTKDDYEAWPSGALAEEARSLRAQRDRLIAAIAALPRPTGEDPTAFQELRASVLHVVESLVAAARLDSATALAFMVGVAIRQLETACGEPYRPERIIPGM